MISTSAPFTREEIDTTMLKKRKKKNLNFNVYCNIHQIGEVLGYLGIHKSKFQMIRRAYVTYLISNSKNHSKK